ncbi:MAG TPA: SCO1664 family protein [Actinomycetota bacterium]
MSTSPTGGVEESELLRVLGEGELEILGLLPRSSNFTFLARACLDGREQLAVYKPRRGETPLWDFPEGTLCQREVAAFVVARELGWPEVPPTLLRDGPHGPGSVQRFVEFDPAEHYFTMHAERMDDFRRVAVFDKVVNNADRKSGHCLRSEDGEIFVVDHGVCFSPEPKLRTVIWEFAGEPIPPELRDDVRRLAGGLEAGATLRQSLEPLLSEEEIEVTRRRAEAVARMERFPHPGPGRPYPWPAV